MTTQWRPIMTSDDFQDSHLEHAVRKCWAAECCPDRLRARVAVMLQEADESRSVGPWSRRGRLVLYPVAAAAAVALVLGVRHFNPPSGPVVASSAVIPAALQSELISTHDRCVQRPNHQMLPGDGGDDATLARAMTTQLRRPVLVARPSETGWNFHGGALCNVGSASSGHLVFTSGSDALSVFSLPKTSMPDAAEGSEFETVAAGHPIVGFVRDNAVFCLVGSGSGANVSAPRLEQLRSMLEPRVTDVASAGVEAPVVAVELIRPIGR